jgi:hypothetical protein
VIRFVSVSGCIVSYRGAVLGDVSKEVRGETKHATNASLDHFIHCASQIILLPIYKVALVV